MVCRSSHYSLHADPPAAHDVLRCAAAEAEMGRTMKRISLTAWIFIGMAAGVALGVVAPGCGEATRARQQHVPAADPVDHRAAAVRHAGVRDRGRRRMKQHGPHRREGDRLFRNRHHLRAVPGTRQRSTWCVPARACRSSAPPPKPPLPQAQTTLGIGPRARLSRQHHRRHGAQRCAAGRGLRVPVRRGLRGHRRQGRAGGDVLRSRWPR